MSLPKWKSKFCRDFQKKLGLTVENLKNPLFLLVLCAFLGNVGILKTADAFVLPQFAPETDASPTYAISLFGTAGYSNTNRPYRYIRTDEHGAWRNLSRAGVQLDVQFSPQWSATIQGEIAPSTYKDNRYHPRLSWAFLTFRPDNHWTLRAGKVRIPLMMNAENMPAAITYVQTNLPVEIYSTSPAHDMIGANLGYTWNLENKQALTLEGYAGYTASFLRVFYRGGVLQIVPENTPVYLAYDTPLWGTSLFWQDIEKDRSVRFKLFYAPMKTKRGGKSWAKDPSRFTEYAPGKYVYIPVSGFDNVKAYERQKLIFATLGVNWHLGNDFYFVGESVYRHSLNTNSGANSSSLYFLLHKRLGRFIPYVSVAGIQPDKKIRHYLKAMNEPTGNALFDRMNMSSADNLLAMQQWSAALGTAYDIDSRQRLKLEWLYTKVYNASFMVTARSDQAFQHKAINMLSLSYNFMFDF